MKKPNTQVRSYKNLNAALSGKLEDVEEVILLDSAPDPHSYNMGLPCDSPAWGLLNRAWPSNGDQNRAIVISISPPVPLEVGTDNQRQKYLSLYYLELIELLNLLPNARCIVAFGKWPARALGAGVGKVRGTFVRSNYRSLPILTTLALAEVLKFPDRLPVLRTDLAQLEDFRAAGYVLSDYQTGMVAGLDYQWCLDLGHLIEEPPALISLDCETIGLNCHSPQFEVLTVSVTTREGQSQVVPLGVDWWNDEALQDEASRQAPRLTRRLRAALISQLKAVLENPETQLVGHNLKFDLRALRTLGIDIGPTWAHDTMQMAWAVDENQLSFSLDDCVRRYLPDYSGYADQFNRETDKSAMQRVEHSKFLTYAGGDTDTVFQLLPMLQYWLAKDERQQRVYEQVMMPTLKSFAVMEERGVVIDLEQLPALGAQFAADEEQLISQILQLTPPAVLRKYADKLRQVVPNMIKDALFGPDAIRVDADGNIVESGGAALVPTVFTAKGGEPSVSTKEHLPYFEHIPYVKLIMDLSRIRKMISTYAGRAAHVEHVPVQKLKNDTLPKKVRELLAKHEQVYETRPIEKRGRGYEAPRILAGSLEASPDLRLVWTDDGDSYHWEREVPATGIWQYIQPPSEDGESRIFPSYLLHGTVTGRASSRDPNAQNQPKRGKLAKQFRKIFKASPGCLLLEADESQAELRIAAWMAQETTMINIYKQDGDIHSATAAALVGASLGAFAAGMDGRELPLVDSPGRNWNGAPEYAIVNPGATLAQFCEAKRSQAKAVNFGFLYGMGWRKFRAYAKIEYGITLTDSQAQEARQVFFSNYPGLEAWHKEIREFVDKRAFVRALHGAKRRLDNIKSVDEGVRWGTQRKAINSPVQRFASDLALIALNQFVEEVPRDIATPIFFIHDALIMDVREDMVLPVGQYLRWILENPPLKEMFGLTPPLPLKADVAKGPNLGEMEKLSLTPMKLF